MQYLGLQHLQLFQSTPPARGATFPISFAKTLDGISIHAPREGGDAAHTIGHTERCNISIHAPREGGDVQCVGCDVRGEHFNPRPPRGGRLMMGGDVMKCKNFNPRPPRGGRLHLVRRDPAAVDYFNPRPPRGGRLA